VSTTVAPSAIAEDVVLADSDHDGLLDVVVVGPGGARLERNTSAGPGSLTLGASDVVLGAVLVGAALADVNLDGDVDLIGARTDSPGARIHLGDCPSPTGHDWLGV